MQPAGLPALPGFELRPITPGDADDWLAFAVLPEVQQYTSTPVDGVADLLPVIERTLAGDAAAPVLFAVRETGSGRLAATAGFHSLSAAHRTAEITYALDPQHWGRGLATRLCEALTRWGFDERGWVRIQATVLEPHRASQRVLQKCGYAYEGRLRNFRTVRGQPRDYLMYARVG